MPFSEGVAYPLNIPLSVNASLHIINSLARNFNYLILCERFLLSSFSEYLIPTLRINEGKMHFWRYGFTDSIHLLKYLFYPFFLISFKMATYYVKRLRDFVLCNVTSRFVIRWSHLKSSVNLCVYHFRNIPNIYSPYFTKNILFM